MNKTVRPYGRVYDTLREAGLRPTRQRLGLARLLFENGDRHVTAEQLHSEAADANLRVSLATIYNTLNQFTEAGLMREVMVASALDSASRADRSRPCWPSRFSLAASATHCSASFHWPSVVARRSVNGSLS